MTRTRCGMHELSIAQGLIEALTHETQAAGATRVERVDVRLGALAGVDPEALGFCFPVAARGTPCEGAELRIAVTPAAGSCPACRATCEVRELMDPCPACGTWPLDIDGGREMVLASVEVV